MAVARSQKPKRSPSIFVTAKENASRLWKFILALLTDPSYTWTLCLPLILGEIILNIVIVNLVKYTEIDWKAYMQEVEGFLNGTYDYTQLRGDTGPLVYPAGFVYLYSALYYITSHGTNIKLAQYIFCLFYIVNLVLIARIYAKTKICPPYVFIFMCMTSYRIHSIFVLRLFNDPVAMMIFYVAANFFIDRKWLVGCLFYSFAVGVKMNIFLFAPALLLIFLSENGIWGTFQNLAVCFLVQVVLGIPFLLENPVGYLVKSFELNRQFFYVWTVNWRLIPEELFLNKGFQLSLLSLHLLFLLIFAIKKWSRGFKDLISLTNFNLNWKPSRTKLSNHDIILMLFTSNFIGICFSRTLHYQFYIWYYHTLPYLLWSIPIKSAGRLLIFGLIEMSWNTYPSTVTSSATLHAMHLIMLIGLLVSPSVNVFRKEPADLHKKET